MTILYRFDASDGLVGFVELFSGMTLSNPAQYTEVSPPTDIPSGQTAIWDASAKTWTLGVDHRHEIWHDPVSGTEKEILAAGEAPPEGWVRGPAPSTSSTGAGVAGSSS